MTRPRLAAALALAALVPAGAGARSWQHADLAGRPPHALAILPPIASITRGHVNEAEPMIKESVALEDAVATHAVELLTKLGYEADRQALRRESCAQDRDLLSAIDQVQSRVDELMPTMSDKPKATRDGRYSIGETAVPVATAAKADALVALRVRSVVPSKGTRALSGVLSGVFNLIPMVPTTHTELVAVVIDGRSGLVEGLFVGFEGGAVLKEPDRVGGRVVDAAFEDYPRPGGTSGRRRSREIAAAAPAPSAPTGEPDEQAVLNRFEEVYEKTSPGPPAEDVKPAPAWTPTGPVAVAAVTAGPPSLPAAEQPAPAPVAAAAAEDSSARALFAMPPGQRPKSSCRAVIQVVDGGGPGIAVRNATAATLRVSVDVAAWKTLAPGETMTGANPAGSHWILVSDRAGREAMRLSLMVPAHGLTSVEIWPL